MKPKMIGRRDKVCRSILVYNGANSVLVGKESGCGFANPTNTRQKMQDTVMSRRFRYLKVISREVQILTSEFFRNV